MVGWLEISLWWCLFAGLHLLLSSSRVRPRLVAALGGNGFQGVYSLAVLAAFVMLIRSYLQHRQAGEMVWSLAAVPGIRWLTIVLAALGAVLMVSSFVSSQSKGEDGALRARGVARITRHPLTFGFGVWGFAHLLVVRFAADAAFFAGFAIFALVGTAHQDARHRRDQGERVSRLHAETSALPFAAILTGRNSLVIAELPWVAVGAGLALAVLLYLLHGRVF